MAETTGIQWADSTWSPWRGCSKISAGCQFCYADKGSKRNPKVMGVWGPNGTRVVAAESYWHQPYQWDREAKASGVRRRIFPSLCDPFEEWDGLMTDAKGNVLWQKNGEIVSAGQTTPGLVFGEKKAAMNDVRQRMFRLIDETPHIDWLLLTKRPENIRKMWPENRHSYTAKDNQRHTYRENVWLIASTENQEQADIRVPELLKCGDLVPVLGLSCEPLLGPITIDEIAFCLCCSSYYRADLNKCPHCGDERARYYGLSESGLKWLIVGGESGPQARPCNVEWIRSIVQQCRDADVACFVKQLGANVVAPNDCVSDWFDQCSHLCQEPTERFQGALGRIHGINHPKGGDIQEFPEDLRVQEFPR